MIDRRICFLAPPLVELICWCLVVTTRLVFLVGVRSCCIMSNNSYEGHRYAFILAGVAANSAGVCVCVCSAADEHVSLESAAIFNVGVAAASLFLGD